MGSKKTLVKNGLLFSLAPFIPKVVSVFLLPIMTKNLTATDYGIAGTISAYSQSIGALSTLGLAVVLMNSFYKDPENYRGTWKRIYGFLNCWMIVYAMLQSLILFFCIPEEAQANKWWIIILTNITTVFFGPTAQMGSAYFTYTKQSVPVVWRSVVAALITMFSTFYLVVYMKTGYMGWYIGGFIGTLFSNATYWPVVNLKLGLRPSYKFSIPELKHNLSVSVPTIPHYYTTYMMEGSGRMVLDQYSVPQERIGQLSISQNIGDMYQVGVTGINQAVSPYFMSFIRNKEWRKYTILAYMFIAIVFSSAFLMSIWSKEIFGLLLSNKTLASAYPYAIVYIMAFCYRPMYVVSTNFNFYFEKTKQLLYITFTSGVSAISFYFLFTPFWGIWAFLIGHYIACLYMGYSGFFYSCYRKNAPLKLHPLIFMGIQILITIVAFTTVEYIFIKVGLTVVLISCMIPVLLRMRRLKVGSIN